MPSLTGYTWDAEDELGRGGGKTKHKNCLSDGLVEALVGAPAVGRIVERVSL